MSSLICDVKKSFFQFCIGRNYMNMPELPLLAPDDSLNFTNSAIVRWKDSFSNGRILKSFGSQRCVRLSNISESPTSEKAISGTFENFLGYFNMLGMAQDSNGLENISQDISDFLVDMEGISPYLIKVHAKSNFNFVSHIPFAKEYDAFDEDFYSWKFDLENVSGNGATFTVSSNGLQFEEIGQLIQIQNNSNIVAYAFGFGIETYLARKNGINSYNPWTIGKILPPHLQKHTVLDTFSLYSALATQKIDKFSDKTWKEMRRITKKLSEIMVIYEIGFEESCNYINDFVQIEFPDVFVDEVLIGKLDVAYSRIQNTMQRYKNVLIQSRDIISSPELAHRRLEKIRRRIDLPEVLVNQIVGEFYEQYK